MTTFIVFSITRSKEVIMDTVEINEHSFMDGEDLFIEAAKIITPPYQGKCVVVKQDDARQFKLRSHVVEI